MTKVIKIENTLEKFFDNDREKYNAFRSKWKAFINEGKAKKTPLWQSCIIKKSKLTPIYHMLYTLVIGNNIVDGFGAGDLVHPNSTYNKTLRSLLQSTFNHTFNHTLKLTYIFGDTYTEDMHIKLVSELKKLLYPV